MNFVGSAAYHFVRWLTVVISELWWRIDIVGKSNIPAEGPFLLCAVHRSNIDGPLTATFTWRRMKYLAKGEMFTPPLFAALIRSMGAIAVHRDAPDRVALKSCVDALDAGHPLVLFPEGGRREGPVVDAVQDGAAYLALRTGVPIIPVGIADADRANPPGSPFLYPAKMRVVIGEPIRLQPPEGGRTSRALVRDGTELLTDRLQQLFDQAARREEA